MKTEKNIIKISGLSSTEDILSIIGAQLDTIKDNFGATGFCDIGFYFNSYNGIQKFNIGKGNGLEVYQYSGKKLVKSVNKKEDLINVNEISFAELERKISMLKQVLRDRRKIEIEERLAEKKRETELREYKEVLAWQERVEKENLLKVKQKFMDENELTEDKGIRVWAVKALNTLTKHMEDLGRLEELKEKDFSFPVYLVKHKDIKYVYFKGDLDE